MHAEFNRGHVDRIRIFHGPTAEARRPKGMFLIYRTVADFLFYQYNRKRIYGNEILFILHDTCRHNFAAGLLNEASYGNPCKRKKSFQILRTYHVQYMLPLMCYL